MATYSKFLTLSNGKQVSVDLSFNTLQVQALEVGSVLLSAAVNSTGNEGSELVGDFNSYSSVTPSTATVKGTLSALDSLLNGNLTNSNIKSTAAIAYSKLATLGGSTNAVLTQSSGGFVQASSILSGNLFLADGTVAATGNFNLNSNRITNVTDPTSAQDAATKHYVDNSVAGLSWKTAVRLATPGSALPSYTFAAVGGGADTLTGNANGALSVDGVAVVVNDRILNKDDGTASHNGIYVVTQTGDGSHPFILTRATDMQTWTEVVGSVMLVTEGTVNTGSKWVNTNIAGGTLDTTNITFTAFSVAGTITGTGTSGYVAYWNGTQTLTAEQFLSPVRGGTGVDSSGATGIAHVSGGAWTFSLIVNADVSATAAIAYSKLNLAGSIVNADIATGAAIAYSKLNLSGSIVNADIATGAAIAYSKLALTNSIVANDLTAAVFDQSTITGGNGNGAAAVQNAPSMKRTLVAGQSFSANTSYAVRWGLTANGETSGRVYAADITTSSFDLFYVIGMASSTSSVSAGGNITVTSLGTFTLSSSDTAFGSNTDGAPVFLTANGTFSTTAPSTAGQAITRVGIVQVRSATVTSNKIDVAPQFIGVN